MATVRITKVSTVIVPVVVIAPSATNPNPLATDVTVPPLEGLLLVITPVVLLYAIPVPADKDALALASVY